MGETAGSQGGRLMPNSVRFKDLAFSVSTQVPALEAICPDRFGEVRPLQPTRLQDDGHKVTLNRGSTSLS